MYSLATTQRVGTCYERLPRLQRISFKRSLQMAFRSHAAGSRTIVDLHDMPNRNPYIHGHANIMISQLLMHTFSTFHVLDSFSCIML